MRDFPKSTVNCNKQQVLQTKLQMRSWLKFWISITTFSWILTQNLKNILTNLKMLQSFKDSWTKTKMKLLRVLPAWSKQTLELTITLRIVSNQEFQVEFILSNGTKNSLTFSKFTTLNSKNDQFKWNSRFLFTPGRSQRKTVEFIWLVDATREETNTLRNVTDTTKSSPISMKKLAWSILTLITPCAQLRVSSTL